MKPRASADARGFEYMEEKEGTSKEESRLINLILSTARDSTSITRIQSIRALKRRIREIR